MAHKGCANVCKGWSNAPNSNRPTGATGFWTRAVIAGAPPTHRVTSRLHIGCDRFYIGMMKNLDLTHDEAVLLLRELDSIIENDRFFLSPRIQMLKAIRAK